MAPRGDVTNKYSSMHYHLHLETDVSGACLIIYGRCHRRMSVTNSYLSYVNFSFLLFRFRLLTHYQLINLLFSKQSFTISTKIVTLLFSHCNEQTPCLVIWWPLVSRISAFMGQASSLKLQDKKIHKYLPSRLELVHLNDQAITHWTSRNT